MTYFEGFFIILDSQMKCCILNVISSYDKGCASGGIGFTVSFFVDEN